MSQMISVPSLNLKLLSWNVLADCYAPALAAKWETRSEQIRDSITKHPADLLFLQEVDHYQSFWQPMLTSLGYSSQYLKRPTRRDGLCIAYCQSKLLLTSSEEVLFDDLVSSTTSSGRVKTDANYERQNVGLLCTFRSIEHASVTFLASTAHLYWNPAKPEVKMAQAKYLLQRIASANSCSCRDSTIESGVQAQAGRMPVLLGGDFNVLPESAVYALLTGERIDTGSQYGANSTSISASSDPIDRSQLNSTIVPPQTEPKFIVDYSLSKLARWMRVLGIDCVVESKQSQMARTGQDPIDTSTSTSTSTPENSVQTPGKLKLQPPDFSPLFTQARLQSRILLTSSRSMRQRANCPPSMLIKPSDLELELSRVCVEYEIDISESRFLTVCGKCGGRIEAVQVDDPRLAGRFLPQDRPVFACTSCLQPYWWNERENSSPARAMRVAERLHKLIRGDETWRNGGGGDSGAGSDPMVADQTSILMLTDSSADRGTDGVTQNGYEASSNQTSSGSNTLATLFSKRDSVILNKKQTRNNPQIAEAIRVTDSMLKIRSQGKSVISDGKVGGLDDVDNVSNDLAKTFIGIHVTSTAMTQSSLIIPTQSLPQLRSLYYLVRGVEAPFTNWNGDFRGTLDYIFTCPRWSPTACEVVPEVYKSTTVDGGVGSTADGVDLIAYGGLPNSVWPSDHLMILGRVSLPVSSPHIAKMW